MPFDLIPAAYLTHDFAISGAAILIAGLIRGFAGFGSAMILSPVLSLLWGPTIGVPVAILVEIAPALQLTPPAIRVARWKTVWALSIPALLLIPVGSWLLVSLPADTMRRAIAILVLTLAAILWSGWRYRGPRGPVVAASVGALGGFLSGSTGIGGPPTILYLMSGSDGPALVRANLICFFSIMFVGLVAFFGWSGLITADILWRTGLLLPVFIIGVVIGTRLFGLASDATFRHIALGCLTASSIWVLLSMTHETPPERPNTVLLAVIVSMIVAFGPMTIDLYLPALPSIATALSADAAQVQRTLNVYMIGFAFSQLIYGPLSDRFGRKPVLFFGVGIYIAASVACALAQSVDQLIAFRFLQAIGASCGPVLGRAIVRDYFTREEAARIMSWVISVMALAPILAPVFGGFIATWADWRMNFWVLTAFAAIVLVAATLFLGESNRHKDPTATNFGPMINNFAMMLRHRIYVGFLITNVFMFAGLFSWLLGSSFVLIDRMGMSPMQYGFAFGIASVGFLSGAQTAARLVRRVGIERMCILGAGCAAVGGFSILVLLWAGIVTPVSVMGPTIVYFFGMGITVPNIQAGAVSPFPRNAGAASSLIGLFQYSASGSVTYILGLLGFDPALLMATLMGVAGVAAIICFTLLVWIPTRKLVEGG